MNFTLTSKRRHAAAFLMLAAATWSFSSALGPAVAAAQAPLLRFEFSRPLMGAEFRLILYAPDATTAAEAARAAFDRIARLDDSMSDYRPSSELMRLCREAGGPPVKISQDLFRVLAKSQEVSEQSNGAFDITVGPVVRLWRRARRQHELPDPESLSQAATLVGFEKLRLDSNAGTARLLKAGMLLDLGGIAKGDAADQALVVLKHYGIGSALVAAAGDIAVGHSPPEKNGWRIGIAPLDSPHQLPSRYVLLHDSAVSTSGDAEQHVEMGGIRYSHIVNPKTGQALTGRSSVTVIAPNGITADSLATAVSVLGPERGLELINSTPGTAVLFLQQTDQGIRTFELRFPGAEAPAR